MAEASTTTTMSAKERYELITRGLQEVLGAESIQKMCEDGKDLSLYWGTAPTGRPHCGYFVPLTKIADFLKAGIHVKILLADVHAFLDNLKAPIELVNHRVTYYAFVLTAVFRSIGVPVDKLEFVTGSSYQYSPEYARDLFRLSSITSEHDSKRAGAEVVKQTTSPPLSGLLYPLLQALDEEYLKVDIQFGGLDQRKIFTLAEQQLPKLGYARRAHLMNGMVPGLAGGKMSSSDPNSKIDFLDTPAEVKKKIKAAVAAPGVVEENGLLAFIKAVLIPIAQLQLSSPEKGTSPFVVYDSEPKPPQGALVSFVRKQEYGGTVHFTEYESIEQAYAREELHPSDVKTLITESINKLLAPIQAEYQSNPDFQNADKLAYPPPPAPEKKVKVKKAHRLGENPHQQQQQQQQQQSSSGNTDKNGVADAPDADKPVQEAVEQQAEEQRQQQQNGDSISMNGVKEALPQ